MGSLFLTILFVVDSESAKKDKTRKIFKTGFFITKKNNNKKKLIIEVF